MSAMANDSSAEPQGHAIEEASAISMERYELSQPRALALLVRLARRHNVDLGVVAAAIVAAAVARRNAEQARPR
jgi:AmiR/NasT family two-component response regulator